MADGTEGGAGDGVAALLGGAGGGGGGGGDAGAGGGAADAGAGGGAGGGGDAGGGAAGDAEWLSGFSADADGEGSSNRDWLKSKGFKTPDDLTKSYRALETEFGRLKASGGGLKVPGEGASAEEVGAYRTAIGVPADAKGYEIKPPEGVELNMPLIERMAAAAHKSGIPKGAFEATVADYIQSQLDEAHAEKTKQDGLAEKKLTEWGDAKNSNIAAVTTAMRALQLSPQDGAALRGALGADRALDLLAKLGNGMAEDRLFGGDGSRFGISAAEAQKELTAQNTDPTMFAKLQVKGSPEALRRERLLAIVAADEERKAAAA